MIPWGARRTVARRSTRGGMDDDPIHEYGFFGPFDRCGLPGFMDGAP
jgi:hypothetical protein